MEMFKKIRKELIKSKWIIYNNISKRFTYAS